MVLFNYSTRELTAKVVYYGPGLCGKTTNLQFIHRNLPEPVKGKMLSLATKTDRTLFFDFLPIDLGEIRGMKTRVQLYTVPGQVFYNETRKLVLKGADGIVFVADSQEQMLGANVESFKNLEENLKAHGMNLAEMPHVIQFNKRDLPKLSSIEDLNAAINRYNAPFYESVATTGIGVQDSLKAITKLVLLHLTKKYDPKTAGSAKGAGTAAAPAPPAPAAAAKASVSSSPSVPLSAVGSGVGVQAPAAARPSSPSFRTEEIDRLVHEVRDAGPGEPGVSAGGSVPEPASPGGASPTPPPITPASPTQYDLDQPAPVADSMAGVGKHDTDASTVAPPDAGAGQASVPLDQAMGDRELFDDPSLEVCRLGAAVERSVVVPVEFEEEGRPARRFKLSIRLRLDPLD